MVPIIAMNDSNSRCNIKFDEATSTGKVKLSYETGDTRPLQNAVKVLKNKLKLKANR